MHLFEENSAKYTHRTSWSSQHLFFYTTGQFITRDRTRPDNHGGGTPAAEVSHRHLQQSEYSEPATKWAGGISLTLSNHSCIAHI